MIEAIILLRARLAWVQAQLAKERARRDTGAQMLITSGRLDMLDLEEAWLLGSIGQLEAKQGTLWD